MCQMKSFQLPEADTLRNALTNLSRRLVSKDVDLFALPRHERDIVLNRTRNPEIHLHRSILLWHHDKYKPYGTDARFGLGCGGMSYDIISRGDAQAEFKTRLEALARMPRGFAFALDIVMQHLWLHFNDSTNYLVSGFLPKFQQAGLVVQECWDDFTFKLAHTLFIPPQMVPPPPYLGADLHPTFFKSECERNKMATTDDLIQLIDALRMPKLRPYYFRYVLPKTMTFLMDNVRRTISRMLVTKIAGYRLPTELQEFIYDDLLEAKGVPLELDDPFDQPLDHRQSTSGQPFWQPFVKDESSAAETDRYKHVCGEPDCCCMHQHKWNLLIRRWDAGSRSYVTAHKADFPVPAWFSCGFGAPGWQECQHTCSSHYPGASMLPRLYHPQRRSYITWQWDEQITERAVENIEAMTDAELSLMCCDDSPSGTS